MKVTLCQVAKCYLNYKKTKVNNHHSWFHWWLEWCDKKDKYLNQ